MTIILFLIALGVLVLVHELGHFLGARKVGLMVEEFSIGFPPRVFAKKIKDTVYSIGIIIFGGFVKLKGENDPNDSQGFLNLHPVKKLIVVLAGIVFNIFLAYFLIVLSSTLGYPIKVEKIFVTGFLNTNTQAYKYFQIGDQITKVKLENQLYSFDDLVKLSQFLKNNKGKEVEIFYLRNGQEYSVKVTPPVGFYLGNFELEKRSLLSSIFVGIERTFSILGNIFAGFYKIVSGLFIGEKANLQVLGPVGIYSLFDNYLVFGIGYVFYFLAILSLNLAVINLLPLPGLDGGHALFIVIEMIRGKKINYQKESLIHQIGILLLFSLLIVVTIKDIFVLWFK
jgi:regulator of sigma E protease